MSAVDASITSIFTLESIIATASAFKLVLAGVLKMDPVGLALTGVCWVENLPAEFLESSGLPITGNPCDRLFAALIVTGEFPTT